MVLVFERYRNRQNRASTCYGLLFTSYQKSGDRWAKAFNTQTKIYSLITVIKRVVAQSLVHTATVPGRYIPRRLMTIILTILTDKNNSNLYPKKNGGK